jgi:hypothetical protein
MLRLVASGVILSAHFAHPAFVGHDSKADGTLCEATASIGLGALCEATASNDADDVSLLQTMGQQQQQQQLQFHQQSAAAAAAPPLGMPLIVDPSHVQVKALLEADSEEPPFAVFPYGDEQERLWGTSYKTWEECDGLKQSPINIVTRKAKVVNVTYPLAQNYGKLHDLDIANNGHALKVHGNFGNLTIGDQEFTADNIHFHNPGEHKIDGELAIAEMHIVNKNEDGTQFAVIAIQFDVGSKIRASRRC